MNGSKCIIHWGRTSWMDFNCCIREDTFVSDVWLRGPATNTSVDELSRHLVYCQRYCVHSLLDSTWKDIAQVVLLVAPTSGWLLCGVWDSIWQSHAWHNKPLYLYFSTYIEGSWQCHHYPYEGDDHHCGCDVHTLEATWFEHPSPYWWLLQDHSTVSALIMRWVTIDVGISPPDLFQGVLCWQWVEGGVGSHGAGLIIICANLF